MSATYHTAIIGAGASGLFCAGSFNQPKILLDHNKHPGVKVGVSGGGKCNFTNRTVSAADYRCTQKHFCKNALAAFKPADFTRLLDQERISYEERAHGQLFAARALDIVHFLKVRAQHTGTEFSLSTEVLAITPAEDGFSVQTSAGMIHAQHVVLACGGLSYPSLGASGFGVKIARQLGLAIIPQRPALCGITFPKELQRVFKSLAGNSTLAEVTTGKHTFTEHLLFTHEGISGPAVLPISLFYNEGDPVTVNFLPGQDARTLLYEHKNTPRQMSSVLPLTGHIARTLLGPSDKPLSNATRTDLETAARKLNGFTFIPAGLAGYTKAEVTSGGIDTREINPSTFEVKKVPGLYAIGELLDVTGRLGGYNLHWAWASGFCAATHLAKKYL